MHDLEYLINRYVDGIASEEEVAVLNELLRSDIQARRVFADHLNLDSALAEIAAGLPGMNAAVEDIVELNQRAIFSNAIAYSLGAMAVALMLAAGTWIWLAKTSRLQSSPSPSISKVEGERGKDLGIATLADEADAHFAVGRAPQGKKLNSGVYELLDGIADIRFASGAEIIINAPAKWTVLDAMHVRVDHGKIRVIVPPSAKGFSVVTPDAEYVDLGTEFGLEVDREVKASDLYVFDGQVNVADRVSQHVLEEVLEGGSHRSSLGVVGPAPKMSSSDFPTPNEIGLVRWKSHMQQLKKAPGLIALFSFRKSEDETVLLNDATGLSHTRSTPHGQIHGARWVSGRWPGKDSLLFDGDNERVELDIPGAFQELTIAAWIKIDRLDYEMNAILNSDDLEDGDMHFQITRQGLLKGSVQGAITHDTLVGAPLPIGRWVHVAIIVSSPERVRRVYSNGKLVREGRMTLAMAITPGKCRIGNWLPSMDLKEKRTRALRGRIDELVVWDRTLTESEIRELVEAGRPNELNLE